MAAPKGNQFWKQRTKHGRDKIFKEPEILWAAAVEYFEWADANPWVKVEAAKAGDHFGEHVATPVPRPYSLGALYIFLDIDEKTFSDYCKRDGFIGVCKKIRTIIRTQKYEGALVGTFKEGIVSREIGLVDRQHVTYERPVLEGGKELPKDDENEHPLLY